MLYMIRKNLSALKQGIVTKKLGQFFFKSCLLLLPIILILGYVEYRLSTISVSYSQKKYELESQLEQIEVLILGSSNAYYGINPEFFSTKGFNLAYRAQWPYYDQKFVEKYIHRMPNLKLVLFSVNYFTLGTQPLEAADAWRIHFYAQYHRILPPSQSNPFQLSNRFDPKLYSKIALFAERTKEYLTNGTTSIDGGEPAEGMTGWFNAGTKPCDLSQNIGPSGAAAHNISVNPINFQRNLDLVGKIVAELEKRKVRFVLLELPELPYYTDNLDSAKTKIMQETLKNFSAMHHIEWISYLNDTRFTVDDFTDMPDHLNATGANKISAIINKDIIVKQIG